MSAVAPGRAKRCGLGPARCVPCAGDGGDVGRRVDHPRAGTVDDGRVVPFNTAVVALTLSVLVVLPAVTVLRFTVAVIPGAINAYRTREGATSDRDRRRFRRGAGCDAERRGIDVTRTSGARLSAVT
jgi:hypothetical protein